MFPYPVFPYDYSHCPCPPESHYVRADYLHCSVFMASAKKEIARRLLLPSTPLYWVSPWISKQCFHIQGIQSQNKFIHRKRYFPFMLKGPSVLDLVWLKCDLRNNYFCTCTFLYWSSVKFATPLLILTLINQWQHYHFTVVTESAISLLLTSLLRNYRKYLFIFK